MLSKGLGPTGSPAGLQGQVHPALPAPPLPEATSLTLGLLLTTSTQKQRAAEQ